MAKSDPDPLWMISGFKIKMLVAYLYVDGIAVIGGYLLKPDKEDLNSKILATCFEFGE
ncbi:MAG: hypothetical protein HPY71_08475 [Firmicutes bacterium]|nr:hypothetical protein [Bacillota bacterium]